MESFLHSMDDLLLHPLANHIATNNLQVGTAVESRLTLPLTGKLYSVRRKGE